MSERGFERLASAPRSVPFGLRANLLLYGLQQIGFFVLLFTTPFVWLFALNTDIAGLFQRGPVARASGTVVRVTDTSASENRARVQAVDYVFSVAGQGELRGRSFVTGAAPAAGERVVVEFPEGRPSLSRIEGMRRATFGRGVLFVLLFPAIGLLLAYFGMRGGARRIRLLAAGEYAEATLQSKAPTNVRVNNRTVMALTFVFTGRDGQRHETIERTSLPEKLEDDRREAMLYDPERPEEAVFADSLPSWVFAREDGQLAAPGAGSTLLLLILPALALGAHGLAAWLALR